MLRDAFIKTLVAGFMAAAFMVPSVAMAADKGIKQVSVLETSKMTIGAEAVKQEVIQILRKGEMAKVTLNVIGRPGVHFKVEYSATGDENSYKPLAKGRKVIGGNGFGSVSFDLRKLGKEEVYLKVTTSDTADFDNPRVTPKPIALIVEDLKLKDRGWRENYNHAVEGFRNRVEKKLDPHRNVNPAVCGVRG
jgi:hypothetical protein